MNGTAPATESCSHCTVRKWGDANWPRYFAPGVFGGVMNWTVAAPGGWDSFLRGIVTRTNGAPADQVYVPIPSIVTRDGVVVIEAPFTTNDPKYVVVPPDVEKKSPLTRFSGREPPTSTRSSSCHGIPALT